MKRKFTLLLALFMLAQTAVSCGEQGSTSDDTTTASADTTTETTVDPLADNLPAKNYNGEEFVIATESRFLECSIQEEEVGDVISDAIYHRNLTVEDRFGVEIIAKTGGTGELKNIVANAIQSDEDVYDLVCYHAIYSTQLAMEGYYLNWYDIDYIDFDRPWWSESTTKDLTVNGYTPIAIGDFALSALRNTWCVYFNHRLADEYKIGNMYDIVNDGKWTLDKALELSKDVYLDVNKNNEVDAGDQFGYVSTGHSGLDTYFWAFGGKVMDKKDGKLTLTYRSEKTADMVTKLCSFFNENKDVAYNKEKENFNWGWSVAIFEEGRALFNNGLMHESIQFLREMKDDYGIIPYPKYDELQSDYYTISDGSHDLLSVPKTVTDTERVGIITEALCAETHKQVIPAYYEVALKTKYSRDDESITMIDKVANSRIFDIGFVYDGWSGASFIFEGLIEENDANFESYWAANGSAIEAYYDSVIEIFESTIG